MSKSKHKAKKHLEHKKEVKNPKVEEKQEDVLSEDSSTQTSKNKSENLFNRKFLTIFVSIFLILLVLLAGAWVYLSRGKAEKSLAYNAELMRSFENVKFVSFESDYDGEVRLVTGIDRLDNSPQATNETENTKLTKEYRFNEGTIKEKLIYPNTEKTDSEGEEIKKSDLVNSDILFLVFSDKDLWNEILANKKYSSEEFTRDNEKFWKFSIDKEIGNKLFMENFEKSIIDGYNQGTDQKITSDSIQSEFDGAVKITIDINQKTKKISQAEFSIDKDMLFNFDEKISADFGKTVAAEGEVVKLRFVLKSGYKQTSDLKEITYENESARFSKFNQMDQLVLSL